MKQRAISLSLSLLLAALISCDSSRWICSSIPCEGPSHPVADRSTGKSALQHDEHDKSFALTWVSRVRGGGKVTADGSTRGSAGAGRPSSVRDSELHDIESKLVANFPNRQVEMLRSRT